MSFFKSLLGTEKKEEQSVSFPEYIDGLARQCGWGVDHVLSDDQVMSIFNLGFSHVFNLDLPPSSDEHVFFHRSSDSTFQVYCVSENAVLDAIDPQSDSGSRNLFGICKTLLTRNFEMPIGSWSVTGDDKQGFRFAVQTTLELGNVEPAQLKASVDAVMFEKVRFDFEWKHALAGKERVSPS